MLSFTAKTSPERSLPCVCGLARTAQCPCLSVSQLHQCIFHAFLHFFSISAGLGGPRSPGFDGRPAQLFAILRSEEHTSALQSLMRTSYAVFCLKKKNLTKHYIIYQLLSTSYLFSHTNHH